MNRLKQVLYQVPILKSGLRGVAKIIRRASRKIRGKDGSGRDRYVFKRIDSDDYLDQIKNLLNYAKTSGSIYNAQEFPAGYHTIKVGSLNLKGQRDLDERYSRIPINFTGKTVLDLGCNQGGMLLHNADKIKWGVGIDYDRRLVNAANKIRSYTKNHHIEFYTFDLIRDDLEIIKDLMPSEKVDITFLLAVCIYLPNWKQVINIANTISDNLLYEANGRPEQQEEQMAYLRSYYSVVEPLSDQSDDRHARKLYLCR